jgi:hypothetical protein
MLDISSLLREPKAFSAKLAMIKSDNPIEGGWYDNGIDLLPNREVSVHDPMRRADQSRHRQVPCRACRRLISRGEPRHAKLACEHLGRLTASEVARR